MIKINIIINNIMQNPMVVICKIIINQIGIINITNKDIIKILDFNMIMLDVIIVKRKVMLRMNVLYGRKLLRKRRKTPN
jgi:hypothetical protein